MIFSINEIYLSFQQNKKIENFHFDKNNLLIGQDDHITQSYGALLVLRDRIIR